MNRRDALIGLGAVPLLVPGLARTARAQAAEEPGGQKQKKKAGQLDLLFVQTAERVSLKRGRLILEGVGPVTLFFSDRPQRMVGHVPTEAFIAKWGAGGDDSFAADPPNATLSVLEADEPKEIVVVLKNPRLGDGELVYDVDVLGDGPDFAEGGASSLFIDVWMDTQPVFMQPDPVFFGQTPQYKQPPPPLPNHLRFGGMARPVPWRMSPPHFRSLP